MNQTRCLAQFLALTIFVASIYAKPADANPKCFAWMAVASASATCAVMVEPALQPICVTAMVTGSYWTLVPLIFKPGAAHLLKVGTFVTEVAVIGGLDMAGKNDPIFKSTWRPVTKGLHYLATLHGAYLVWDKYFAPQEEKKEEEL